MIPSVTRLLATREGGQVRRSHVLPHNSHYTVGLHSYGAVSLLLLFHPSPSLALIRAVQWHDVAERWMGDVPSPVKSRHPELREVYERIEQEHLVKLGLASALLPEERNWLRAVDLMELWLWCREEERAGNGNVAEWSRGCARVLADMHTSGNLPGPLVVVLDEFETRPVTRLSDHFENVEQALRGPHEAGS